MASLRSYVIVAALVGACSDESGSGNTVAFDLDGPLAGETFWNLPFPSDLRLTPDGRPDLARFPNPRDLPVVNDLLSDAGERGGFPVMPIAWFRFTEAAPQYALADVIAGDDAPAVLVDIDPASPHHGQRYPIVAQTLAVDLFTGEHLVALAPRPGIVLEGHTKYAYVLRAAFAPEAAPAPAFAELAADRTPAGSRGQAARELYAPLWETLAELGITRGELLAATVFTTGDEVGVLRARSEAIRATAAATIANLHVDPVDGAAHDGFCELVGEVTVPTYQVGAPPFDSEGKFVLDGQGTPIAQGETTIPVRITIPTTPMPAGGWPLWQFFHGSGGLSADLVDDGPSATAEASPEIGKGPGFVVAKRGIAAVSAALPANPERLPGASNYAYLNLNNLAAFPYTFQQGAFEQRLLLDALLALEIPQATVAACGGATGATSHHFDASKLMAGGHSMGGMYTNMIAAVEPRYGAVTPFGAGGLWNMMILDTAIVSGARDLLGGILGVDPAELSFVHPTLALIGLGWEIAEPITSMARLARSPLAGMPARHIYQPIGMDDQFFPNPVFDAAALAYGNRQAGDIVWPETQDALRVDHLEGLTSYPVRGNREGTTAVVVQYSDGGILDAHYIHRQLDAVKFQYGCFLASYLRDGTPTVPAPDAVTAACP